MDSINFLSCNLLLQDEKDNEEEEEVLMSVITGHQALLNGALLEIGKEECKLPAILKADGTRRKVNRQDYSRGPKRFKSTSYWTESYWLKMIADDSIDDPTSKIGREFQRKFRIPFPAFRKILDLCRNSHETANSPIFNYGPRDAAGQSSIPLELKILAALRVLASDLSFGDVSELTNNLISESECQRFCRQFYRVFSKSFAPIFIKPLEGSDMINSMKVYAKLGLPGCVGSLDATFVGCNKLPQTLSNLATGEKGKGLLFNVVVDHSGRVLHVQEAVLATINDKTSVVYNEFVNRLSHNEIYHNAKFRVFIGPNNEDFIVLSSCYVIADGGYINIPVIISGYSNPAELHRAKYKFADWVASIRKDVECFFGILKQRFRILKNANNIHDPAHVNDVFMTCCVLHNLILIENDGHKLWEKDINWELLDPPTANEEISFAHNDFTTDIAHVTPAMNGVGMDSSEVAIRAGDEHQLRVEDLIPVDMTHHSNMVRQRFDLLRDLLANHLHYMYSRGKLQWPKTRQAINKEYNASVRCHFPTAREFGDDDEDPDVDEVSDSGELGGVV